MRFGQACPESARMLGFCGPARCVNTPPGLTTAKDEFAMAKVPYTDSEKCCEECGGVFRLKSPRYRSKFLKQRYCSRLCAARAAVKRRNPESQVVPMEIGSEWGLWIVISAAGRGYWNCRCACGTEAVVFGGSPRRGNSKSCGCRVPEISRGLGRKTATHGLSKSREFAIWMGIRARCRNPRNGNYPRYGGRGIEVCDLWFDSFEAFYGDMGPRPSPKHSIDRIDNDGNYEPSNCRWADLKTQANNQSHNRVVTYRGQSMTLTEAAQASGIPVSTLGGRLRRGVPPARLFKAGRQ